MALEIDLLHCCCIDCHSEPSVWRFLVHFEGGYPECVRDYEFLDDAGESAAWLYGRAKFLEQTFTCHNGFILSCSWSQTSPASR